MDLAVVINTTDKYSHLWEESYLRFVKYFHVGHPNIPVYFLNEWKRLPRDSYFTYCPPSQICVDIPEVELWTKKLRESVRQIPESNLFILLEDLFLTDWFEEGEFEDIYQYFLASRADALRIQPKSKYTTTFSTLDPMIRKLSSDSKYLIAHTPNIWRKDFLLHCIQEDEDPWTNEIEGTMRIQNSGFNIYHYEKDWFANVLRRGKVDPKYKDLL